MRAHPRRTVPSVVNGQVRKKHNWAPSPTDYWVRPPGEIVFDRESPARGFRHLLTVAQMRTYLALLPEWEEMAVGLRAVMFAGDTDCDGWYGEGVVALCNWPRDLWEERAARFVGEHAELLALLGVEVDDVDDVGYQRALEALWPAYSRTFSL